MANLPIPPTVITESVDKAEDAVGEYQEAIFKPLYTSKARGMAPIKDGPTARQEIENFKRHNPIMYIQKKIDLPGYDLGLAFLGGEHLATYARSTIPTLQHHHSQRRQIYPLRAD
ncbi:MAG: hypothetical protein U5J62_05730 [Desulfurivibrio sp.]|nr:hypothetical protein [Desulfurivibrio sp.]